MKILSDCLIQEEQFEHMMILDGLSPKKREVAKFLMEGYNCFQISRRLKVDKMKVYKIKEELKVDLAYIRDNKSKIIDNQGRQLSKFLNEVSYQSRKMSLANFASVFINDYSPEAQLKQWGKIPLQNRYYNIWQKNAKSCIKAPREHMKTTSVCHYLVKRLFERQYPLEIIYLHGSADIAIEKVRQIQGIIERNPVFAANMKIDEAKNWKDGELRLHDNSYVYANAYGCSLVGRHPHIIILDDIIDQSVIFSDLKNEKAKRKFYSDIYPMITDAGEDKKIIIIGTAQREDDIYNSLPDDFYCETMRAIVNEEQEQVLEPALYSWETLQKVKKDMSEKHGEKYWLKEYMNAPFTAMGDIIKPDWIKTYQVTPQDLKIYQGWDLSVGKDMNAGDFTAGITIGTKKENGKLMIYVLDIYRNRIDFAQRLKVIQEYAEKWQPIIIGVEENVFQYDTVQTLKKQTNLPIKGIKTLKNKVEKFQVDLAPHFENGKILIRNEHVDLKNELLSLPYGKNDDMVDALCNCISISAQDKTIPIIDFF